MLVTCYLSHFTAASSVENTFLNAFLEDYKTNKGISFTFPTKKQTTI